MYANQALPEKTAEQLGLLKNPSAPLKRRHNCKIILEYHVANQGEID